MKDFRIDIGVFRVAVIAFLMLFHSFCPFGGHWTFYGDIGANIPAYWWLDNWSYSFFLQGFVFISGYLFGIQIQRVEVKDKVFIQNTLKKKFVRLMIPSLVFSILFMLLFNQWQGVLTPYRIMNGWFHLWFLPMLFSSFVVYLFLDHFKVRPLYIIIASIVLMLIPLPGLPMRVDVVCKYFIFFYLGVIGGGFTYKIPNWSIPILAAVQIVLFAILYGFETENIQLMQRIPFIPRLFEFLYSSLGIAVLFASSRWISYRIHSMRFESIVKTANKYCFGIYIWHQFILFYLYFRTPLPLHINHYLLPWLFLVITVIASIILTYISKRIPYLNRIF